ncbi:MAG: hypothetical protein Q9159_001259 [Coniocarpon cinnabarinum]
MYSRKHDQENLTHAHHVAGAAKRNALGSKTPGPQPHGKTPARKVLSNDENTIFATGKGKTKDVLQTPAPRERAPLGAKTTNAKTKPFATPAALPAELKPQGNIDLKTPAQQRARTAASRHKLRVHHSPRSQLPTGPLRNDDAIATQEVELSDDDSEPPEIETANRLAEPDMPDSDEEEYKIDHSFPELQPQNLMRGAMETYFNPVGEDGLTPLQRDIKRRTDEDEAWLEDYGNRLTQQASTIDWEEFDRLHGSEPPKNLEVQKWSKSRKASNQTIWDRKPPSEVDSKAAASALSVGPRATQQRSASASFNRFAAPTAASQARQATVGKQTSHDSSSHHERTRKLNGHMASRSTIGRAKGRQVSAELRAGKPKMAERKKPNLVATQTSGQAGHCDEEESIVDVMARQYEEDQAKERGVRADLDDNGLAALQAALDEQFANFNPDFQLPMPEGVEPLF